MIVIPWFLIPGRPYPIQVYLYACAVYSTDPGIGQRGAAEATREKYGLETFSHSTVCRSFKSFEQSQKLAFEKNFGKELRIGGTDDPQFVDAAEKVGANKGTVESNKVDVPYSAKRYPSVTDTVERREKLAKFFPKVPHNTKPGEFESISRKFSENWHRMSMVLLI